MTIKQVDQLTRQARNNEIVGVLIICAALLLALLSPYLISRDYEQNTPPAEYLTQNNSVYAPLGGRGN